MESFQELDLPEFLRHSLQQMNFVKPMPVQAQAIPPAMEGKDVIASAQTGTGKTAAFGIPLLAYLEKNQDKTALVLTPTRELAMQVLEVLRQLAGAHPVGGSVLLIGGANMATQISHLSRKPRLVIGTPGRIIDHLNRGTLALSSNGFLVLDEADRMLDMGFAPQLDEIRKRLIGHRQTLLFSATIPPDIQQMAAKYLKDPVRITVGSTTQPIQKIAQKVLYTTEAKKPEELSGELKERQGAVLVFARTQHRVDRIMKRLKEEGVKVTRIHGGRTQSQRGQAIEQFREGKFLVLVATDIAARGLDILNIAHVINYDLPKNPEDYIHRVGRTARAGALGESLCFITPEDGDLWRAILRLMNVPKESIPVKPSRFGFTAPSEVSAQTQQASLAQPYGHPERGRPHPGSRHEARPQGQGGFQPSHAQPHHRQQEGRGYQGGHRDSQSRDFHPQNRHPDGRHQQRPEQHRDRFQRPQESFQEPPRFNEADGKQPLSNASRDWAKPEGFIKRLGRKFMGKDRPPRSTDRFFTRDDRHGTRKEGWFSGGGSKPHHRPSQGQHPHRFEHRTGEQRPFSGEHRSRPENRFDGAGGAPRPRPHGEQRHWEHRSDGGNRPHRPGGNFHPKGGFRRPGEGNSRPSGFRPR